MKQINVLFFLVLGIFCCLIKPVDLDAEESLKKPLKLLHLTFHRGCAKQIDAVCKHFGFEVETWLIQELPPKFFDGITSGNALYNIGHKRALDIWNIHKETFQQFDAIITSDTAPLARIFLQNGFSKPLIIWVCNRFDYSSQADLDCDFPDAEFYRLFNEAHQKENVTVIAYTAFEQIYALKKGVDIGNLIITPCALEDPEPKSSIIDSNLVKKEMFFLPAYHNETIFFDFAKFCKHLHIPAYCGRYNGPTDLKNFKGIIHLPYAWSNLALFENIAFGIPYFIPSPEFLLKLLKKHNYWHQDTYLLDINSITASEWYQPERKEIFTYFDSWRDLQQKIKTADYCLIRKKTKEYSDELQFIMMKRWEEVFNNL